MVGVGEVGEQLHASAAHTEQASAFAGWPGLLAEPGAPVSAGEIEVFVGAHPVVYTGTHDKPDHRAGQEEGDWTWRLEPEALIEDLAARLRAATVVAGRATPAPG